MLTNSLKNKVIRKSKFIFRNFSNIIVDNPYTGEIYCNVPEYDKKEIYSRIG
ncbi:unnamed protein product, partial [marine sediment metagenome]